MNSFLWVAAEFGLIGRTRAAALATATTSVSRIAVRSGCLHPPLVQRQLDSRAGANHVDGEEAKRRWPADKQPRPADKLGELMVFRLPTPPATSAAWLETSTAAGTRRSPLLQHACG